MATVIPSGPGTHFRDPKDDTFPRTDDAAFDELIRTDHPFISVNLSWTLTIIGLDLSPKMWRVFVVHRSYINVCASTKWQKKKNPNIYTMSASLGDALLFVTLDLGAAIKREFIYVFYSLSLLVVMILTFKVKSVNIQ